MNSEITPSLIATLSDNLTTNNPDYHVAQRTVMTNGLGQSAKQANLSAQYPMVFSHDLDTGPITNQKLSGRCWLFATLNTLRPGAMKKLNTESIEFSTNYLYFWDKLEKCNVFYEKIIARASEPVDTRDMEHILNAPQQDGGFWEYAVSLIDKYGIVPIGTMPETAASGDSRQLNAMLNKKLRRDALVLRSLCQSHEDTAPSKTQMLSEVYRILTIALGTPPVTFDFAYKDKKKKLHRHQQITPTDFLSLVTDNKVADYITLLHDPSRPFDTNYTVRDDIGMIGGITSFYVNTSMDNLKKLVTKQIVAGEPVWFGCDIKSRVIKEGYMVPDALAIGELLSVDLTISKADRISMRDDTLNHAVTITGVDIVDNKPHHWKVENSWGEDLGKKGFFAMSNEWFNEYGYMVTIRKDLLPAKLLKQLDKPPVVLEPWDPLTDSYL